MRTPNLAQRFRTALRTVRECTPWTDYRRLDIGGRSLGELIRRDLDQCLSTADVEALEALAREVSP